VHRSRPQRRGGVRQHLQPFSRRPVPSGRQKDGVGAVTGRTRGADNTAVAREWSRSSGRYSDVSPMKVSGPQWRRKHDDPDRAQGCGNSPGLTGSRPKCRMNLALTSVTKGLSNRNSRSGDTGVNSMDATSLVPNYPNVARAVGGFPQSGALQRFPTIEQILTDLNRQAAPAPRGTPNTAGFPYTNPAVTGPRKLTRLDQLIQEARPQESAPNAPQFPWQPQPSVLPGSPVASTGEETKLSPGLADLLVKYGVRSTCNGLFAQHVAAPEALRDSSPTVPPAKPESPATSAGFDLKKLRDRVEFTSGGLDLLGKALPQLSPWLEPVGCIVDGVGIVVSAAGTVKAFRQGDWDAFFDCSTSTGAYLLDLTAFFSGNPSFRIGAEFLKWPKSFWKAFGPSSDASPGLYFIPSQTPKSSAAIRSSQTVADLKYDPLWTNSSNYLAEGARGSSLQASTAFSAKLERLGLGPASLTGFLPSSSPTARPALPVGLYPLRSPSP
jgi:hypothetical protein